jgi:hypothetical protein
MIRATISVSGLNSPCPSLWYATHVEVFLLFLITPIYLGTSIQRSAVDKKSLVTLYLPAFDPLESCSNRRWKRPNPAACQVTVEERLQLFRLEKHCSKSVGSSRHLRFFERK